jgi:hypothetical protein
MAGVTTFRGTDNPNDLASMISNISNIDHYINCNSVRGAVALSNLMLFNVRFVGKVLNTMTKHTMIGVEVSILPEETLCLDASSA